MKKRPTVDAKEIPADVAAVRAHCQLCMFVHAHVQMSRRKASEAPSEKDDEGVCVCVCVCVCGCVCHRSVHVR